MARGPAPTSPSTTCDPPTSAAATAVLSRTAPLQPTLQWVGSRRHLGQKQWRANATRACMMVSEQSTHAAQGGYRGKTLAPALMVLGDTAAMLQGCEAALTSDAASDN